MREFEIIEGYFARPAQDDDVLLGVGDDAALLRADGTIAVTVDTLVEGVHFLAGLDAEALGHRVLAVNLSDLAAMGARPRWCTLALTLADPEPAWLERFARGFYELAARFGVSLVGGNLARGPLSATVQLIGSIGAAAALRRSGGRPGDDVYVSGTLGDAAAGLAILKSRSATQRVPSMSGGTRPSDATGTAASIDTAAAIDAAAAVDTTDVTAALIQRFLRPCPRVDLGRALAGVASAAIDVSDGLAGDLGHLCRASGCCAVVDVERVPLSPELTAHCSADAALEHALGGGDDYELCFTAPSARADLVEAAAAETGTPVQRIGRLVEPRAGGGIEWRRAGGPYRPAARGYLHF
jgi:thiamine-monophosphate kinase